MIQQPKKLASFLRLVGEQMEDRYGDQHISTILHGGIVLNEFTLKFSDIDLIVVLTQVTPNQVHDLVSLWKEWSTKHPFGEKLWINLIGEDLLETNRGAAWTISKKGVRPVHGMPIDGMELHTLLHRGKTLKGKNIISRFPRLPKDYQIQELDTFLRVLETYSMTSPLQPQRHQSEPIDDDIGIILSFPRYLYNLQTDKILTKCHAAKWYGQKSKPFRTELLTLARYRLAPQKVSSETIFSIYRKVPEMVPYFWNEYFKHLGINLSIPQPVITPTQVHYQETFYAIRSGLQARRL
ncbi:hypothetical protein [Ammoniphilus sp. CFH 90114]|uniref:hypothetical protein n=1 Tax=Ammoniphilus sp. CFH 90114 TaxID=2493665 RepID=UPI00100E0EDD|nr:hypothetical protein [Ammoniphilus sp. CFH 90114]RXT04161.1 hypothetical protein EIZ39_21530 [Ammoniphilus sp. CFH 90114]